MKRYLAILLVVAFSAHTTQQVSAQFSVNVRYSNYHEYLDLNAVATAFSRSGDIFEFEQRLNDYRNPVSNLDLNYDGYIDYLRVVQYSERYEHVIQIQAVLGVNVFRTVATVYVGRDRYNNEYIHIEGHESIYGRNYIIQPVFRRRPVIVRWLWNWNSPRYVSPYYWGYYPRYYRTQYIVALPAYHHRVNRYVDHRTDYRRLNSRPALRDNRGQVERGAQGGARVNEADRRQNSTQRPTVDPNRDRQRQSDVRQPANRQETERQPANRQSDVRQQENRQPATRQSESNNSSSSSTSTSRERVSAPVRTPQQSTTSTRTTTRSTNTRESNAGSTRR
jgi:hypothetical protein